VAPVQVREPPPQSVLSLQLTDEHAPLTTPWQEYWLPRVLHSLVAQQVLVGPVQVPALSPLQTRVPPQNASVVQPVFAGQVPLTAPLQVAPAP